MTHLFRPELLVYFLSSPFGRAWVKSVVSQQVGQANVNGTKLRSLTIPLPPRGAQSAICDAVRRQMEALEKMRASLREGAGSAGSLKMSVLHRAFTAPYSGLLLESSVLSI